MLIDTFFEHVHGRLALALKLRRPVKGLNRNTLCIEHDVVTLYFMFRLIGYLQFVLLYKNQWMMTT